MASHSASLSASHSASLSASRYRIEVLLLFVLLVSFALLAARDRWLERIDHLGYDTASALLAPALDPRIVIVAVDQESLARLGRWPWNRVLQAQLIEQIAAAGPRAVLVDVVYDSSSTPVADQALLRAVAALPDAAPLALPMILDAVAQHRPPVELLPFPDLLDRVDALGHVHIELDLDSISRGTYLYQGVGDPRWPHLALALADAIGEAPATVVPCDVPSAWSLANQRCAYRLIPFVGPPGTVPAISAASLIDGTVDGAALKDRVVLVGLVAAGVADWVTTPVSGAGRPMSGVEYNANLLNAVLADRLIRPAAPWVAPLLCALLAGLAAVLLPRLSPKGMILATLGLLLLPLLLGGIALALAQLYLPLAAASVAALGAYPYWSWRRHEIAWRYVDQEMARLAAARSDLPQRAAPEATDWPAVALQLAELLELDYERLLAPVSSVGYRVRPETGEIELRLGAEGALLLRPFPSAPPPVFEERTLSLIDGVCAPLLDDRAELPPLPGEGLANRIRGLRQHSRALERDRAMSAQALDDIASAVAVISPLGQIELANERWLALTGLPAGAPVLATVAPAAQGLAKLLSLPVGQSLRSLWQRVVRDRELVEFESALKGGPLVFVSCAPLDVAPPGSWAMTLTDVTEITQARSQRDEALAFLSHDLRSPIQSMLALLQQPGDSARDDRIAAYAQRSLSISEQFLKLSRLEAEPLIERDVLDALAVLDNAIDSVFELARQGQVRLLAPRWADASRQADTTSVAVLGNGELLERAFANVLGNAVKYGGAGTEVSTRLELLDEPDGMKLSIAVRDEGPGIPESDLEHLFEPYFRSRQAQLAEQRGAGLGLRFARTVMDRHEGKITVTSELGAGSTFRFLLPVHGQVAYNDCASERSGRTL